MHLLLALLSILILLEALLTLRGVFGFRKFFLDAINQPVVEPAKWPRVGVLAPCKGEDPGLAENIRSWMAQDYPDFQIIFIVEDSADPAVRVIREVANQEPLIAGIATDCGQKIHNLRFAIDRLDPQTEVLTFVDSDCRLKINWLRNLISRLMLNPQDAVTGYRWFDPPVGNPGGTFKAVWNSSVLTLYEKSGARNFCWGGATAIYRSEFDAIQALDFWKGCVSDDFGLTNALRSSNRKVHLVPAALTLTSEASSFSDFVDWASRQLFVTRVYFFHLWVATFGYHILWIAWFILGLVLHPAWFAAAFAGAYFAQAAKAGLRLQCADAVFGPTRPGLVLWYLLFPPIIAVINFLI